MIKTDEQYRKALEEVGRLAEKAPVPESTDGARLELLAKLVEDYEKDSSANQAGIRDRSGFRRGAQGSSPSK